MLSNVLDMSKESQQNTTRGSETTAQCFVHEVNEILSDFERLDNRFGSFDLWMRDVVSRATNLLPDLGECVE